MKQEMLPGLIEPEELTPAAAILLINFFQGIPYFLVAKRLNRRGRTIPGGKLKPGENPQQGAIRELKEETGLQIYSEDFLISTHPDKDGFIFVTTKETFLLAFFLAYADEACNISQLVNPEPSKHSDWDWLPLTDLSQLIIEGQLHQVILQEFMIYLIEDIKKIQ